MNRFLITATIVFLAGLAAAGPAKAKNLPTIGDTIVLAVRPANMPMPRVGDPDGQDFETNCDMSVPLTIKAVGTLPDPVVGNIIVAEYRSTAKDQSPYNCRNGSLLLFSQDTWVSLKAAQEEFSRKSTDQERRRETVRELLKKNGWQRPAK